MKRMNVAVPVMVLSLMLGGLSTVYGGGSNDKGAASPKAASGAAKQMTLGWVVARDENHPYTVAAETFAKVLTEKTNGAVTFKLFPGGQLGGDKDMFEALQLGNIDAGVISAPVIAGFTKVLVGTDMPYVFKNDLDMLYAIETGEPGKKLLSKLEAATNVKALTFTMQPFRHFFSNKEIKTIADMKGMKLRCMQTPVHIEIFKALGANPTPIPYTEVYTSMQSGVIDGFESDVIGANSSKFYEVAKYLTISGHFNNAIVLLMSQKAWNKLTPAEQVAAQEAANAAAKASLDLSKAVNAKYIQVMKDKGMKVNELDQKALADAEKPVIAKYMAEIPEVKEFVDAISNTK